MTLPFENDTSRIVKRLAKQNMKANRRTSISIMVYNLCNFNVAISIILIVEFMINVVIGLKLFHNQSI